MDILSRADKSILGIMDKNNLNSPTAFYKQYENHLESSRGIRSQLLEELRNTHL
jgi:hypothetical protein